VKLVTICFSHYNERARWALDHFGLVFDERPYMPAMHFFGVLRETKGRGGRSDSVSSRFSTPVLVRDDGSTLSDSGAILRWADATHAAPGQSLYPAGHREEIEAFEQEMHDRLGPHGRRVVYQNLLGEPDLLQDIARRNVGAAQARIFGVGRRVVTAVVRKSLRVDAERSAHSMEVVREQLARVSERLQGRRYLFAGRFTAADLTFACMAAPVLLPPEYGAWLPPYSELPEPAKEMIDEFADTPAIAHGRRMFAEYRRLR
jgi:glutathione S-transferase